MQIVFIGASHRTASVETRGQLAIACGHPSDWLARIERSPSIREAMALTTCHRVEVYVAASDAEAAAHEVCAILGADAVLDVRFGSDAIRHLGRVACGLDSLILGEAEIVGQIRRAADAARRAGTLGPHLEQTIAACLHASGRARSETRIAAGAQSAAGAAVLLTERTLGSLSGKHVLVIGAGQAGRQALDRFAKRRTGRLQIASRSGHHAQQASTSSGAEIVSLDRLDESLAGADAVLAATQSDRFLVTTATCEHALASRAHRSLLAVDLSVPSVIDPAVSALAGVTLHTVDDLGDIVRESTARRLKEVPRVEAIVEDEISRSANYLTRSSDRPIARFQR